MTRKRPPYRTFLASDSAIRDVLRSCRTIAALGLDADEERLLRERGYRIVHAGDALALAALGERVDLVHVARPDEDVGAVADAARKAGAVALWLGPGVDRPDDALAAHALGLAVVMNRSLWREYQQHFEEDE